MSADYAGATIEYGSGGSITLLELMKQILGITDNTQDDALSLYLQAGGEACERYIDNKIASQTVVEDWSHARDQVALRYYPVIGVGVVLVDGVDEVDDYLLFEDEGIQWVVGSDATCNLEVSKCFQSLRVTYTAGYDVLPADLGYAIVMTAMAYEAERGAVSGAIKKEVINGVGSVEYSTGADSVSGVGTIPSTAVPTLDMYRRYHV